MTANLEDEAPLDLELIQLLNKKRVSIANEWYHAILPFGNLPYFREDSLLFFEKMTDAVIKFLSKNKIQASDAKAIGVELASLKVIDANLITNTGDIWYRTAHQITHPNKKDLILKIGEMMYHLSAGYFEHSQRMILLDQEQIRKALVSTIERTTQELRIHQTRLEEILDERTQQLQLSEKNFRQITETSLEGIFQLDISKNILFVNESFSQMIGIPYEELYGKSFLQFIPEKDKASASRLFQKILNGQNLRTELQLIHKAGHVLDLIISGVRTDLSHEVALTFFATDISERIKAEGKLIQSERKYRTLAETAQVLICVIDIKEKIEYINSFAASFVGISPENILGTPYSSYLSEKAYHQISKFILKSFQGKTIKRIENLIDFPTGSYWFRFSLVPLSNENHGITSVLIVATDITAIKNSNKILLDHKRELEKAVKQRTASLEISQEQIRNLARQIVSTQEDERRRVSRELHDEAGQALMSLKYELETNFNELGLDSVSAKNKLASMLASINDTNEHIRQLSHSLRPPALDIAGINLSLEDYCNETSDRIGIKIEYQGVDLPGLADEIGICLYRVLQEALANIMKHSKASKVTVKLSYKDPMVKLSIIDNGEGMDLRSNGSGTGLLGIKERTSILGGAFVLKSQPGSGTQLLISIPWKEKITIKA